MRKYRPGTAFFVFFAGLAIMLADRPPVSAQGFAIWNPADRQRPWTPEINPAVIAFQDLQLSLGMKVFHLGFVPGNEFALRENRLNLSWPLLLPWETGVGVDLRHFTAGLYSETAASLLFSREFLPGLSLGLKWGIERRAFDASQFVGIDPDDPLLAGSSAATNFNVGVGAYFESERLLFGVGVDHLNRPNVGQASTAIFPREIALSLGYRLGLFLPTLLLHDDGVRWRYGFSLVATRKRMGAVRIGYENGMPLKIEAQLRLHPRSQLDYALDLPGEGTRGASAGTQELVYTHILKRRPDIQQPEILLSTNRLEVLREKIIRSMSAGLTDLDLKRWPELLPDYVNSTRPHENVLAFIAGPLNRFETRNGRIQRWRRLGRLIVDFQRRYPNLKTYVLYNGKSRRNLIDAAVIRKSAEFQQGDPRRIAIARLKPDSSRRDVRGFRPGRVSIQRKKPRLSARELRIELRVPGKTRRTYGWQLIIRREGGRPLVRFSGNGALPEVLKWDWRDGRGRIVGPGSYLCELYVRRRTGRTLHVVSQPVEVVFIYRTVRMRIRSEEDLRTSRNLEKFSTVGEL